MISEVNDHPAARFVIGRCRVSTRRGLSDFVRLPNKMSPVRNLFVAYFNKIPIAERPPPHGPGF